MSSSPAPAASNKPFLYPPWPGYRETQRRLDRLTRFKHLIIHRERWAPELRTAPALDELFPGENLKPGTWEVIQRIEGELRECLMITHRDLRLCGVSPRTVFVHYDADKRSEVTRDYDVALDYFHMSREVDLRRKNFEVLMERLDMAIGIYRDRLPRAKREGFSPITWLAYLIRIPITVLERAGMMSHPENQKTFIKAYVWVVETLMLVLIIMALGHYGAKIPWSDIISWATKAAPK